MSPEADPAVSILIPADADIPGHGPLDRFWRFCLGRERPDWRRRGEDPTLAEVKAQKDTVRRQIEETTDPDPTDPYADQREKTESRRLPDGSTKIVSK